MNAICFPHINEEYLRELSHDDRLLRIQKLRYAGLMLIAGGLAIGLFLMFSFRNLKTLGTMACIGIMLAIFFVFVVLSCFFFFQANAITDIHNTISVENFDHTDLPVANRASEPYVHSRRNESKKSNASLKDESGDEEDPIEPSEQEDEKEEEGEGEIANDERITDRKSVV